VVSINSGTLEQLETLDGIGPSLAQRIIDYRTAHGGFRSLEQLDDVSGIGPARLAALRGHVSL
jgi:competence protein ComEA